MRKGVTALGELAVTLVSWTITKRNDPRCPTGKLVNKH
jgi:hypothetical protein